MRPEKFGQAWLAMTLLGLVACGPGADTPEGMARQFMDQYYVAINLARAKELCDGLARTKIEKELELTRGQEITPDTRKPHIRYRLLKQSKTGTSLMVFLFENEIRIDKKRIYMKRCQVFLRKRAQGWKVSHFKDYDA